MAKSRAKLRVYTDTSVIGGCHDRQFAKESRHLLKMARAGQLVLPISQMVLDELADAPPKVRKTFSTVPTECIEYVELTEEVLTLRDAYLKAGIVGPRWIDDATRVAAASVVGADAIVSWNFRHIVRVDRIGRYNLVNIVHGYRPLTIVTPMEINREDQEAE